MEDYHNRVFRYLSYDEERVLTEIMNTLDQPEKNIVSIRYSLGGKHPGFPVYSLILL